MFLLKGFGYFIWEVENDDLRCRFYYVLLLMMMVLICDDIEICYLFVRCKYCVVFEGFEVVRLELKGSINVVVFFCYLSFYYYYYY